MATETDGLLQKKKKKKSKSRERSAKRTRSKTLKIDSGQVDFF